MRTIQLLFRPMTVCIGPCTHLTCSNGLIVIMKREVLSALPSCSSNIWHWSNFRSAQRIWLLHTDRSHMITMTTVVKILSGSLYTAWVSESSIIYGFLSCAQDCTTVLLRFSIIKWWNCQPSTAHGERLLVCKTISQVCLYIWLSQIIHIPIFFCCTAFSRLTYFSRCLRLSKHEKWIMVGKEVVLHHAINFTT